MTLTHLIQRIARIGHTEKDTEDQRIEKSSLTLLTIPFSLSGLIWGALFMQQGLVQPALIPFTYGWVSLLSLLHFAYSKKYRIFRNSQLVFILLLPLLFQLGLGGFWQSGAMMIWAFIGPMGAVVFLSARKAWYIFWVYIALLVIAYFLNGWAAVRFDRQTDSAFILLVLLMNICAVSLLIYLMLNHYVQSQKTLRGRIKEERDRSDALLLNILPEAIAEELKATGKAQAQHIDPVTILFTDFVDFTSTAASLSPDELVADLNVCFKAFDMICERHGIEKIKTIGDSYMAAGGLPVPTEDAVQRTVLAALEMLRFMRDRADGAGSVGIPFRMRVGVHTGPVVAGIVGVRKFQYDIWGDTVNVASRMESHGVVGKVNVSGETHRLLRDDPAFNFTSRGMVEAKGLGEIEMFLVEGTGGDLGFQDWNLRPQSGKERRPI